MKTLKTITKAVIIIIIAVILLIVALLFKIAYFEPSLPDEITFNDYTYVYRRDVNAYSYVFDNSIIRENYVHEAEATAVHGDEVEATKIFYRDNDTLFIAVKADMGNKYDIYCRKDVDYSEPALTQKVSKIELRDDKGKCKYEIDASYFDEIRPMLTRDSSCKTISGDEKFINEFSLVTMYEDIVFPVDLCEVSETEDGRFGLTAYSADISPDYYDITYMITK